ncbi:aminotransferase class I/II-fold pyridoxal phosphate-dependent enzyme [Youxingia wuxianensis]|uniref:Aminotransferase class I/II-fold pyridoxal phosphate-dependent enzyme n=1 Tax=Youxingia wuxianensis TaxID=2763678 RepID=A0A926EJT0_9FIRM|nr:aminotransferase class I/II-fold pyridoxal phosphate-dependent enzyme [Youxingia wuxianensis]MBC8584673.1 aminotransferase class I/II-fold pyridoxal phosphate-dependent enzyme [Youxingia wuxianensis]
MSNYSELSREELQSLHSDLLTKYEDYKKKNLKLDMSRGKPAADQFDLVKELLDTVNSSSSLICENGMDCRNYGLMDGIPEAKRLLGEIMGVQPQEVIVGGNSSLNLMYDVISWAYTHGIRTGALPWCKLEKIKFLCPVPGYDRHFKITESFGIEMINVEMTSSGPDMDMVEKLAAQDESIKGIWCVPKYSNPQGITYSDETVRRMARMKTAAKDFIIMWDNAYSVHDLYPEDRDSLLNIMEECKKAGDPSRVIIFSSTSKISYSGAGLAGLASSEENIANIKKLMTVQTIGFDKINQLRHVRYFKNYEGILSHMDRQAQLLRPKFKAVLTAFEKGLAGKGIASWVCPKGGYFISLDVLPGCAQRVVSLCKEAGVVMTPAGATYPYGKDPKDQNIRVAPTYPTVAELEQAVELLVLCVELAAVEKLLG